MLQPTDIHDFMQIQFPVANTHGHGQPTRIGLYTRNETKFITTVCVSMSKEPLYTVQKLMV